MLSLVKEIINMKKLNVALAIFVAAVMAGNAQTPVTVTSDIVGYTSTQIKGTGSTGSAESFTIVPVQLQKAAAFVGTASASTTTVTLNNAGLTAGALSYGAVYPTHYLRVTSGSGVGKYSEVVSNTTGEVVLAADLSAYIPAGTSVEIIPFTKVTDVLGASGSQVIASGANATAADNVYLTGSDGNYGVFYYKSGVGAGFKTAGNVDASLAVVYPGEGIIVGRKVVADSSSSVVLVGGVPNSSLATPVDRGFTTTAGGVPIAITLNDVTSLLASGANATVADNLYLVDPTTRQLSIYYYKSGVGAGWKTAGNITTLATTDISQGFVIQRKGSTGALLSQTKTW